VNVKLYALDKMSKGSFLDYVRVTPQLLKLLKPHAGSANWRVRHAIMLMMPKLVKVLKEDDPGGVDKLIFGFDEGKVSETTVGFKFFYGYENKEEGQKELQRMYQQEGYQVDVYANDQMAQIRKDYPEACKSIAELLSSDRKGSGFVNTHVYPVLMSTAQGAGNKDQYQKKAVLLLGLIHLAEFLDEPKLSDALAEVKKMSAETDGSNNPVPNLRLMIARELPKVFPYLPAGAMGKVITPALNDMALDTDPDVKHFAEKALEAAG